MNIDEAIAYLNRILSTIETDSDKYCAVRLGIEALEFRKTIFTRIEASLQWLVNDDGTWNWDKWEELKAGLRLPSETYIPESVGVLPSDVA